VLQGDASMPAITRLWHHFGTTGRSGSNAGGELSESRDGLAIGTIGVLQRFVHFDVRSLSERTQCRTSALYVDTSWGRASSRVRRKPGWPASQVRALESRRTTDNAPGVGDRGVSRSIAQRMSMANKCSWPRWNLHAWRRLLDLLLGARATAARVRRIDEARCRRRVAEEAQRRAWAWRRCRSASGAAAGITARGVAHRPLHRSVPAAFCPLSVAFTGTELVQRRTRVPTTHRGSRPPCGPARAVAQDASLKLTEPVLGP